MMALKSMLCAKMLSLSSKRNPSKKLITIALSLQSLACGTGNLTPLSLYTEENLIKFESSCVRLTSWSIILENSPITASMEFLVWCEKRGRKSVLKKLRMIISALTFFSMPRRLSLTATLVVSSSQASCT